ncbi:NAD(P)-dependent oxidoreductase [Flavobacterium ammoniigenes]|jgi:dTDP-4-dehydrorhamnose reductase|uniref:dTDP-4-dehydrorhamnose reductase n=1 Tax=Flavobacterium ammoniigenes TaxID=1751095 RepID=A0ABN6KZ67_9FLAO|nr:SDR family oxidoreductase [Flavobacterium ammoniigenes]BDB54705.1 NAD(P)-dependent oxidoreductase [Flavobacterium ammoniigenes]
MNYNKSVLITGISGMLGMAVYRHFKQLNSYKIFGISRNKNFRLEGAEILIGDLTSEVFLNSIQSQKFNSIIHCSAEVNVNLCEIEKDLAFKANVYATELIFSILDSDKYIYISTDAVFDGKVGNYTENSFLNPLSYYAETKLLGEGVVKKNVKNHYILRTNIYGFNVPMKKSLFEWGYTELKDSKTINGFSNMYFNPMYVGQLAEIIEKIIVSNIEYGIYNVATNEKISKYDFLLKIKKEFDFSKQYINRIEFNQNDFVAPRALNTTLDNSKIRIAIKDYDFSIDSGFSMLRNDFHSK